MNLIFLIVSFMSSVVGAVCGIGGGVIIKPVLDLFHAGSVSAISFLSGCAVLSMSSYSVGKGFLEKDSQVDLKTGTPLAIGAAFGGILGKNIFSILSCAAENPERIGGYQAVCLVIITFLTLLYTLFQDRIKTYRIKNGLFCLAAGTMLGICSSFLGIGGGPINLAVLYFFFSMPVKAAAQNSLYIILVSQVTSLLTTIITGKVPEFKLLWLIFMIVGGVSGGIMGRYLNKKMKSKEVKKLFHLLMCIIIAISCWNAWRFLGPAG